MQKIFFLSVMNGAAWGGSEELWYQSALWCAKNGFETGVCCFDWDEKKNKINKLTEAGCKVYLLPGKEQTKRSLTGNSKVKKALAEVPFEDYELVIVNQGGWKDIAHVPFSGLHSRLKNYVLLFHNYNTNEKISPDKIGSLTEWCLHASKNIAVSKEIFRFIKYVYGITIPAQLTTYNPLTITVPGEPAKYPALNNKNYTLSVFAALDVERKAQDVLVNAMADPEWQKNNCELHLYGDGKDKSILQKLVAKLHLEKKVFLHGNAKDIVQAFRQSHLVLQITHIDAMPISVIEAMATARPLIVSNAGDMREWVRPKKNGWVCKDVTVEAISETLNEAWKSKDKWEVMGLESFRIFKEEFPADPVHHFLQQCEVL